MRRRRWNRWWTLAWIWLAAGQKHPLKPNYSWRGHLGAGGADNQQQQQQQQQQQKVPYPGPSRRPPDQEPPPSDGRGWGRRQPQRREGEEAEEGGCWGSEWASREIDKGYFFRELKKLYKRRMLPLELSMRYGHFASPPLGPADFDAKPMVLLLGQYSVGKTSFIRALLGRDFPGQRIGPEPTTDRFVAVMHAEHGQDRVVPGNALAMRSDKPFAGLQGFGNRFLEKLQGAEVTGAPILENLTLIDSPGVLSGEKQRIGRDYDFQAVVQWFAERCDMILLMFDAHKLDISDELKATIDALRPHYGKIRVLLNKAETMPPQQLLRVYGALLWQLGRVMGTPEVVRVLLGSFSSAAPTVVVQPPHQMPPYRPPPAYPSRHPQADPSAAYYDDLHRYEPARGAFTELLERERRDLYNELASLPRNAVLRKINDLSKRGRFLKVHCFLVHYLRKQMPLLFGKDEKRSLLLNNLHREFADCANRYGLSMGDFPNVDQFRIALAQVKDIRAFPKLDKSLVADMDRMFAYDIPQLLDAATLKGPPQGPPPPPPRGTS